MRYHYNMPHLIIFIGPPAGGKTTTAKKLAQKLGNSKVVEVDEIKIAISGSVFGKDDAERELWFKKVNEEILEGLKAGRNVIVDEGFFEKQYLDKILVDVEKKPVIVEINYRLKDHLKRSSERKGDDVEAIERMYQIHNSVENKEKIFPDMLFSDIEMSQEQIANEIIVKALTN